MKTPIKIVSICRKAYLTGGAGALEAILECTSFYQAKTIIETALPFCESLFKW
jgi:hypothetical protein